MATIEQIQICVIVGANELLLPKEYKYSTETNAYFLSVARRVSVGNVLTFSQPAISIRPHGTSSDQVISP